MFSYGVEIQTNILIGLILVNSKQQKQ